VARPAGLSGTTLIREPPFQLLALGVEPIASRGTFLPLGDRACLALARSRALPALTTDRAWRDVDIDVTVEVIRPD
jgi:hypothetical protein